MLLVVLAALYLLPFVWMVSTSFKTEPQSIASPPVVIPSPIVLDAFPAAIEKMNFLGALGNTLFYAVTAMIGTLVSCSLVAYGFAIVKWPGRDIVFVIVLATMMLPTQVTLIPLYVIYAKLGWINTYLPAHHPFVPRRAVLHLPAAAVLPRRSRPISSMPPASTARATFGS